MCLRNVTLTTAFWLNVAAIWKLSNSSDDSYKIQEVGRKIPIKKHCMTDYHYKGNLLKVDLKDEYSLEVEELHIKNFDHTNNSIRSKFFKYNHGK